MAHAPTLQQQAFYDALLTTSSNIALMARAGCGKTTTILGGVDRLHAANPRLKILVCCYNKDIKTEIADKLKAKGYDWRDKQASTVHGLGKGLVDYVFGKPFLNQYKVRDLVKASNDPVCRTHAPQVVKLVSLAKQAAFGFFPKLAVSNAAAWFDLADHHGVSNLDDSTILDKVVAAAQTIYALSLEVTDQIDFDDMVLFPLVKNLSTKFTSDVVFVDEAQDLSPARQALIKKFIKPATGRIVVVGDDRQAIYGFSGADTDALPNQIKDHNAVVLPLSVTWRCPKAIVALAQQYVPDIEAADAAPEGEVHYVDALPATLVPGRDTILCRNVAPLVEEAYSLIRRGIPAKVLGRDIGQGLISLARKWKCEDSADLASRLRNWRFKETQNALARGDDDAVISIEDKSETLLQIIEQQAKDSVHTVDGVCAFIESIFPRSDTPEGENAETRNVVVLSSYHKAKGREWDNVYLLEHDERCPSPYAKKPWQKAQEANLAYVAITRAKRVLTFVR
jgi:superfamily I DNA/RNA helicase